MSMNVLVKEWMTPNPVTIASDASMVEARSLMEHDDISRLLVVDQDEFLVGILSLRDVVEAWPSRFTMLEPTEIRELMARVLVDEVMTAKVVTVDPETSIAEAANLMFEHTVGALPVLENRRIVGILTYSDLLRGLVRILTAGGGEAGS